MIKEKSNEKKLEDILKEQREEYQRYLGVLAEDFDSKVDLIAEQYSSIQEKLDSHTEEINSLKEDIEIVKTTLDSHTKMIGAVKVDTEIIKTDIEFIKNSLKKKVDLEEFEALEKRVAVLEGRMSAMQR